MQFPKALHNSDAFILYEMPAGKPDPHGPCGLCPLPSGSQLPVRVLQTGSKDSVCWYYVMNFLRQRVGKNPCETHKPQREIEMRVSHLRKAHSRLEKSLPSITNQLHAKGAQELLTNIWMCVSIWTMRQQ